VVPWKNILRTPAVLALTLNQFACNWVFYIFMSWLPTYYETRFHLDLEEVGRYSLIPMPIFMAVLLAAGYIADQLQLHNVLSLRNLRRTFQCLALSISATSFFILALVNNNLPLTATVVTVTFAYASLGICAGGKDANFIDLTPKYASSVFAFANVVGSLPGIVGVYMTGYLLEVTGDDWSVVFFITGGLCVLAGVVWVIFVQTDPVDFDEEEYLLADRKGVVRV